MIKFLRHPRASPTGCISQSVPLTNKTSRVDADTARICHLSTRAHGRDLQRGCICVSFWPRSYSDSTAPATNYCEFVKPRSHTDARTHATHARTRRGGGGGGIVKFFSVVQPLKTTPASFACRMPPAEAAGLLTSFWGSCFFVSTLI